MTSKPEGQQPALQIVGDIGKIALQPGDVLVVTVASTVLSLSDRDHIEAALHRVFPDHKALILEGGAKLEVARKVSSRWRGR